MSLVDALDMERPGCWTEAQSFKSMYDLVISMVYALYTSGGPGDPRGMIQLEIGAYIGLRDALKAMESYLPGWEESAAPRVLTVHSIPTLLAPEGYGVIGRDRTHMAYLQEITGLISKLPDGLGEHLGTGTEGDQVAQDFLLQHRHIPEPLVPGPRWTVGQRDGSDLVYLAHRLMMRDYTWEIVPGFCRRQVFGILGNRPVGILEGFPTVHWSQYTAKTESAVSADHLTGVD